MGADRGGDVLVQPRALEGRPEQEIREDREAAAQNRVADPVKGDMQLIWPGAICSTSSTTIGVRAAMKAV